LLIGVCREFIETRWHISSNFSESSLSLLYVAFHKDRLVDPTPYGFLGRVNKRYAELSGFLAVSPKTVRERCKKWAVENECNRSPPEENSSESEADSVC
jgi:hypothetical protein